MTSQPSPVVAVLLAAGAGTRYTGPTHKLLAPLGDTTVIQSALDAAIDADIGPVLVVTGAVDVSAALRRRSGRRELHIVHHPGWDAGQATSLQVAVAAADRLGADAVVVGLGDQPFVAPEAWRRVAASEASIAVAEYGGRRRNPVRLDRTVWPLLPTAGDEGARALMRMRPELVEAVPCPGSPDDIDTQEDLPPWPNRS